MTTFVRDKHSNVMVNDFCSLKSTKISDPYEVFGFGVLAYFQTLRGIMFAMAFMTICFLPVISIYGSDDFLNNYFKETSSARISLGNLG
jgi:hypothetical protein